MKQNRVISGAVAALVLPALMGTDGIWLAIVVAELLALAVSAWFLWRKRGKYRYA